MTTTTCRNDSPIRLPVSRPIALLKLPVTRFAAWWRERRTRRKLAHRELARLPDHLLCDIGLVRTGSGFTRIREARPLYRAELFGDHLYRMTREKQQ